MFFCFLLLIHFFDKFKYKKEIFVYVSLFSVVIFLQVFFLEHISYLAYLNLLAKIIFGYIIVNVVGRNFRYLFFRIMTFISLISLLGMFLTFLDFSLPIRLTENQFSAVFYTQVIEKDLFRNSGMFWEPGVFGIYLNLVFFLYLIDFKKFINTYRYSFILLFVTLLTTQSTSSYMIFIFIITLLIFNDINWKRKLKKLIILFPLIFFIVYSFDFLGNKIIKQYNSSMSSQQGEFNKGREFKPDRFNALIFDLHYIKKHPIIGNGMDQESRWSDHQELIGKKLGHGNGLSNFIATMGLLAFATYLYLFHQCNNRYYIWLFICLALFSEPLLNFPLFLALPFIFLKSKYGNRSFNYIA